MRIIEKIIQKIKCLDSKSLFQEFLVATVIISLAFTLYSLGILQERRMQNQHTRVHTVRNISEREAWSVYVETKNTGKYFASKYGTKVYSLGCGGGRIDEKNRIYFDHLRDIEALGYTLFDSCVL